MSLNLDARQRAMLEEMGVQVWSPRPLPAPVPMATAAAAPAIAANAAPARAPHPASPAARPAASRAAPPAPSAAAPVAAAAASAALTWELQAPQPLYPQAQATAPTNSADAAPCWLLVAEGMTGVPPLAGDAGALLDNMLHALGLRQQPRIFICTLTPVAGDSTSAAPATPCNPCSQVLSEAIAQVQPAVVLVMGRAAARSALGRSEPLGQLRALAHSTHGVPAVVTYDAPYLLRAPGAKAAAWDDLCRARALALQPPP